MDLTPQVQVVVPDVAAALIEVINLSRPKSGSLHRNLKLSLAQLIAEIRSPGVAQALAQQRDPFKTVLHKVASSLEEVLSSDYLKSRYLEALEKENLISSLPFSLFRVGFWGSGNKNPTPTERIDEILCRPFPTLHLLRDLVQRCNVQNIELEELLNGDGHVKELNYRVQRWNSLVDKIYDNTDRDVEDSELIEAEIPKPPTIESVFQREDSVHHLSQALYDVLHKNWPCDSENHNHNGRLGLCLEAKFCLDPQWTCSEANDNFLMLFTGPDIMQECRVCVNSSSSYDNAAPACLIDHDDQSRSVCLYLAMDGDNQLWNNQRSARPVEIMMAGEIYVEMSLSKLLTIVKPTYSAKRVMGVTLARSILHLFEGPWLDGCMSIDDIYVYCKIDNNQPYPVFEKVFIATRFGNQSKTNLTSSGKYKIHPFPTILALGIILIELELGEEFPDIKSKPLFESKKGQPFYLARYLLKEFQKHFTLDSGLIRAVKFCIDRASFSRFDTLDSEALLHSQEFIDTYYNNIVRPLEQDLVKGAHWTWEQVDDLRPPNTDTGVCKVFTSKTFEFSQTTASDLASVQFASSNTRLLLNDQQGTHDVISNSRWSASLSTNNTRLMPKEVPIYSKSTRSATCTIDQERSFFAQQRVFSAVPEIQLSRPERREHFEIAIICALQIEANAVQNIFEEHWDIDSVYDYGKQSNDPNSYSTGSIGRHNVVLAHQPRMGKATAAKVAATCSMSFPNLKLILIVGVCGGVPSPGTKKEILLGDVVISKGIVQYDFGRRYPDGFRPKATIDDQPGRPDIEISSLIARLETKRHQLSLRENIAAYLDELDCGSDTPDDIYPGHKQDKLFGSEYVHKHQESHIKICTPCLTGVCNLAMDATCEDLQCDQQQLIPRFRQNQRNRPYVHFGLIASGDTVLKSAPERDRISKDANVIAFEMEGSGVWDTIPCVIIKGVCDYADSHKNKRWQEYAAMTAAATAKALLRHWASARVIIFPRNYIPYPN